MLQQPTKSPLISTLISLRICFVAPKVKQSTLARLNQWLFKNVDYTLDTLSNISSSHEIFFSTHVVFVSKHVLLDKSNQIKQVTLHQPTVAKAFLFFLYSLYVRLDGGISHLMTKHFKREWI